MMWIYPVSLDLPTSGAHCILSFNVAEDDAEIVFQQALPAFFFEILRVERMPNFSRACPKPGSKNRVHLLRTASIFLSLSALDENVADHSAPQETFDAIY